MPNVGPLEIGIFLLIALIVFGPKKLPDLGKSLGRGICEFKGSLGGEDEGPTETSHPATIERALSAEREHATQPATNTPA
jgi:sec-independent protein translocase protein TatA